MPSSSANSEHQKQRRERSELIDSFDKEDEEGIRLEIGHAIDVQGDCLALMPIFVQINLIAIIEEDKPADDNAFFSKATTLRLEQVHRSMQNTSSRTVSDCV